MNLVRELKKIVGRENVKKNEQFSSITTFKIGGKINILVTPTSVEEMIKIKLLLDDHKIKHMVVGNGSNILARDGGYNGVVIKISHKFGTLQFYENEVVADAGVSLNDLIVQAKEKGLCGIEHLIGIPGTLGGAVYMNAGAYGTEIKNVVTGVLAFVNGKITYKTNEELEFNYRHSVFQNFTDVIILRVEMKLIKGKKEEIAKIFVDVLNKRKNTQPINFPSAGSVFKKIETNGEVMSVGKLVDSEGLKGMRHNDAMISTLHGNFIINTGHASFNDVEYLINYIKSHIKQKHGFLLETEIKIVGEE